MSIHRHVEYINDTNIQQFNSQSNPPFQSPISFYFIRNKRRIIIYSLGSPHSVLGTEILFNTHKTDSPICFCSITPDGFRLIASTQSKRAFLYDLKQSPSTAPINIGPDIIKSCFINNETFIFSNGNSEIFESNINHPIDRKNIAKLPNCTINSIDYLHNTIFYSTSIGLFAGNQERLIQSATFSITSDGTFLYVLTSSGIFQLNPNTFQSQLILHLNTLLKYLHCQQLDLSLIPFCYLNDHLFVCSKDRLFSYHISSSTIGPLYINHESEPLLGIVSDYDNKDIYLVTSLKPIYLSFPAYKTADYVEKPNFFSQLKNHLQGYDFAHISDLVKQYPEHKSLLIPILIDSYLSLPEISTNESFPLLFHTLKKNKGSISFEDLYLKLVSVGRENEIWRFVPAFEIIDELLLIRCIKSCKLPAKEVSTILKHCNPHRINAAEVIESYPELAAEVYKLIGDASCPFVLPQLCKIDHASLRSMKTGDSLLVEARISEAMNEPLNLSSLPKYNLNSSAVFYLLETAKQRGDWSEACSIASLLKLEDEIKYCRSKMSNTADSIREKLLKPSLDVSEQNEILMQLVTELEKAPPGKKFGDYLGFSRSITKRIDSEMKTSKEKRNEETKIIEEMTKLNGELRETKQEMITKNRITTATLCERCKKALGRCRTVAYTCGHCFHEECHQIEEMEIKKIEGRVRKRPMKVRGCPACGPQSSLKTYKLITNESEWSLDL